MREVEHLGNVAQCNTSRSRSATRWVELLLILFGSACAHLSHGANGDFSCAKVTPSELYTPKYGRLGDSDVCEGYYDKTVSRPFIELVSLTTVPPKSIAAMSNINLRISTPRAPPGALNLLIQPFSVANPYRVDALIVSPAPLAWDARQLRQAMKSSLKDVGFVATGPSSGPDLKVAPVRVGGDASSDSDPVSFVYATVRVSDEASHLQWRGYPTQHAVAPASLSWTAVATGHLYSEEWATVEIPMKTEGGNTTVEFKALDSSNAGFRPLRFVILGIDRAAH